MLGCGWWWAPLLLLLPPPRWRVSGSKIVGIASALSSVAASAADGDGGGVGGWRPVLEGSGYFFVDVGVEAGCGRVSGEMGRGITLVLSVTMAEACCGEDWADNSAVVSLATGETDRGLAML